MLIVLGSNIEQMSASSLGRLFAGCDVELLGVVVVAVVPDDAPTVVDVGEGDFVAACELFLNRSSYNADGRDDEHNRSTHRTPPVVQRRVVVK